MTNLKVLLFVFLLLCFSNFILSLKIKSRKLGKLEFSVRLFNNSTAVDCSKFKTFNEVKGDFTTIQPKKYRKGNTACYCTHCYFLNADCIKNPGLDNSFIGICIPEDITIPETNEFKENDEITCLDDKNTSEIKTIQKEDQSVVNSNNSTSINSIGGNSQINSLSID